MRVEVVDNVDALLRLKGVWDAVYAADREAQVFLSWTWTAGWIERLRHPWIVLAVRPKAAGSDYVGFLPLQIRVEPGATAASATSGPPAAACSRATGDSSARPASSGKGSAPSPTRCGG